MDIHSQLAPSQGTLFIQLFSQLKMPTTIPHEGVQLTMNVGIGRTIFIVYLPLFLLILRLSFQHFMGKFTISDVNDHPSWRNMGWREKKLEI